MKSLDRERVPPEEWAVGGLVRGRIGTADEMTIVIDGRTRTVLGTGMIRIASPEERIGDTIQIDGETASMILIGSGRERIGMILSGTVIVDGIGIMILITRGREGGRMGVVIVRVGLRAQRGRGVEVCILLRLL